MSLIFDLLAAGSIVGIWPRFIEPKRLKISEIKWPVCHAGLAGLTIVHITDLHLNSKTSQRFLNKVARTIKTLSPDLLLFSGDFLCYSTLDCKERLFAFLEQLKAPLGSFCTLGNHDYAHYVTLNEEGVYGVAAPPHLGKAIRQGMRILLSSARTSPQRPINLQSVPLHSALCDLLDSSCFQLLENRTVVLPIGLNVTGLGDLACGRCDPEKAFENFDSRFPGIALSHNPDSLPRLLASPAEWILSGHTHGEQIHIPWPKWGRKLSQKLARLENSIYSRGLFELKGGQKLYVNRGLGCHKPFRLFSPPEILVIRSVHGN